MTTRSNAPPRRSGRWRDLLALGGLIAVGACAPRAPVPLGPDIPRSEPTVRVGLVVDTTEIEVGATTDHQIVDAATGRVLLRLNAREVAIVSGDLTGGLRIRVGGNETSVSGLVSARPASGGRLRLGDREYRGSALIRPTSPGRLTVINEIDLEGYLLGVVPHEIGRVGPELLEAAKAQAVAARTYAIANLGRRSALGFDVFATVEDQVYGGAGSEHEPVTRAVRETSGEILVHGGAPIQAYYHSTCAGRTAAIEEVWPQEPPRPYLVSVVDVDPRTGEAFDASSSRFRWTQRWSAAELHAILSETLADSLPAGVTALGELRDFEILELTPSGRIREMRITTSNASFVVGGDRIRWIFRTPSGAILNSSKFDLDVVRDSSGRIQEVVATGMGWGHGIGMCQVGAMGRARAGQDYRTILEAYYPGAALVRIYRADDE